MSGERRVDLGRGHFLTGQLFNHGLGRFTGDAANVGHGLIAQAADAGFGFVHLSLQTVVLGLLADSQFGCGLGLRVSGEAARTGAGVVDFGLGGLGLSFGFGLNAARLIYRFGDRGLAVVLDLAKPRHEDLGEQDVEDSEDEEEPDDLAAPMFKLELGQTAAFAAMGGDFRRTGRNVVSVRGAGGFGGGVTVADCRAGGGCGLGGDKA